MEADVSAFHYSCFFCHIRHLGLSKTCRAKKTIKKLKTTNRNNGTCNKVPHIEGN